MDQNQLLFSVIAAFAASLLFVAVFFVLFFRNFKKRLNKQCEDKLEILQLQAKAELENQLELFKGQLKKNNAAEIATLKEELKSWSAYEVELLKSKLKNMQPSYPKKLEAAQKLAVLLNTIITSPAPLFTEWRKQLQQYLINYTGMIGAETENIISLAIAHCDAQELDKLIPALIKAKAGLKEGASVSSKLV